MGYMKIGKTDCGTGRGRDSTVAVFGCEAPRLCRRGWVAGLNVQTCPIRAASAAAWAFARIPLVMWFHFAADPSFRKSIHPGMADALAP